MSFRVTARTVLQLGAELISSDGVAFYELIKNAFDAKSKRVEIELVVRIPGEHVEAIRTDLKAAQADMGQRNQKVLEEFKKRILECVDVTAPDSEPLQSEVSVARTWDGLQNCLEEANYIVIKDTGEGMSLRDLDDVYLTIGTRARLKERLKSAQEHSSGNGNRPVLGEKGLGRLSVMRLGNRIQVRTTRAGEARWNELNIDWTRFSNESDALIGDIDIQPKGGEEKESPKASGTILKISGLTESWSKDKLLGIARSEFSKLTDPFTPNSTFPISIRFNDEVVPIPAFNRLLFEHAHAVLLAEFGESSNKREFELRGSVTYRKRSRTFAIRQIDLLSIAEVMSPEVLKFLGPFSMRAYWFNRRILQAIEGIGDLKQVRDLVAHWGGGLMVYRDGFRVNPYGSADDDWLELDPKALASPQYKVNRRQIIGKVDISAKNNPKLIDQTNREGLRDCREKEVLVKLLQHLLEERLRRFLVAIDKYYEEKEGLDFDKIEERVTKEQKEIRQSLELLKSKYPKIDKDTKIITNIDEAIRRTELLIQRARELADRFERRQSEMVNLAGLGLLVEVIAHELNRATLYTLSTIAETRRKSLPVELKSIFATLESQLKTIQKRLRVLDPVSTAGRQHKEDFELISWIKETLDSHAGQFQRHGIECELKVVPKQATMPVRAVKGMVVQVLENLISNSIYWFKRQKSLQAGFVPRITVTVNVREKNIAFGDNGPGIEPDRKEEIFEAFVTTKPPQEGKGLGLFISQEIARYNGARLYLSDATTVHENALNTFVLQLEAPANE
jgi:signal transduction histidine kinase